MEYNVEGAYYIIHKRGLYVIKFYGARPQGSIGTIAIKNDSSLSCLGKPIASDPFDEASYTIVLFGESDTIIDIRGEHMTIGDIRLCLPFVFYIEEDVVMMDIIISEFLDTYNKYNDAGMINDVDNPYKLEYSWDNEPFLHNQECSYAHLVREDPNWVLDGDPIMVGGSKIVKYKNGNKIIYNGYHVHSFN